MIDFEFTGPGGRSIQDSFQLLIRDITPTQEDIAKAGSWFVGRVRERTLSGVDYEGNPFAAYSPTYAFRKRSSRVDLYSSGNETHMLDALTYRQQSVSSLEVGIFGDEKLATRAKALNEGVEFQTRAGSGPEGFRNHPGRKKPKGKKLYGVIPPRRWLAPSDADLTEMEEIIANAVVARLNQK